MRLTLVSGLTALIATVHLYPDSVSTVYNFEVPTHHNYYVGNSGVLVHNANKCFGVILKEIEDALGFSFATEKAKESLIVLLREAGFGDNISGLATYKNLLSQFKDDVSFIKALQQIPPKDLPKFLNDCSPSGMLSLVRQVDAAQNYIGVQAWKALLTQGAVFVRSSLTYFSKFMRLTPDVQTYIAKFTDESATSTLVKFLDDTDDAVFRSFVNAPDNINR